MPQPDDLCYIKAIDMRILALFAVVVPYGNPGLVIKKAFAQVKLMLGRLWGT
jgi:hypothetical protein